MKHVVEFQKFGVELPRFAEAFVAQLMMELQTHDVETYNHCLRVSQMSLDVAQEMKLNILEQAVAMYAGLLHDVGKKQIPVEILNKPGRLTAEEFEIMKKHAQYGVDEVAPLATLPFFKKVSEAILYHHERIDGKGYHGVPAEKIPLASKIILVVDTVDAMTQDRPYRKGMSLDTACEELIRCSGTQFEAAIVDVFLESLERFRSAS